MITFFYCGFSYAFYYSAQICLTASVEEEGHFSGAQLHPSIKSHLFMSKCNTHSQLKRKNYLLNSAICISLMEMCCLTDSCVLKNEEHISKRYDVFINIS